MIGCVDTMRRKPLVLAQSNFLSSEPIQIETQTQTQCLYHLNCSILHEEERCSSSDDHSICSGSHEEERCSSSDDECREPSCCEESECCESSLSTESTTTSCEDNEHITIHKAKHDHDHVGLFSNNFIKLS